MVADSTSILLTIENELKQDHITSIWIMDLSKIT